MVNLGRPSMGCFGCKKDRVKCDLQRPSCGRCKRLHRPCPGYPDTWDVVHRQQNEQISKKVQLRIKRQQHRRKYDEGAATLGTAATRAATTSVPRNVDYGVETYAFCQMYDDFCFNSSVGVFVALPFMASGTPAMPFLLALEAAALAHSSASLGRPALLAKAKSAYGAAVAALQKQITEPDLVRNDSVLVSVFLLGLFEVIAQQLSDARVKGERLNCHPHSEGALALIRYRIQHSLDNPTDLNVFIFCRHVRLLDIFLAGTDPGSLAVDFVDPWTDWVQFCGIEPIVQKCVNLTRQIRTSVSAAGPDLSTADAAALLDQIIQVIAELGHAATLTVQQPSSIIQLGLFNGLLRADNETSVTVAKSLYLTLRLHITEMLLSLVGWAEFPIGYTLISVVVDELCEHIRSVMDSNLKLCNGEPGMASRLFLMSWPMLAVLQSRIASAETRLWLQKLLEAGAAGRFPTPGLRKG